MGRLLSEHEGKEDHERCAHKKQETFVCSADPGQYMDVLPNNHGGQRQTETRENDSNFGLEDFPARPSKHRQQTAAELGNVNVAAHC